MSFGAGVERVLDLPAPSERGGLKRIPEAYDQAEDLLQGLAEEAQKRVSAERTLKGHLSCRCNSWCGLDYLVYD